MVREIVSRRGTGGVIRRSLSAVGLATALTASVAVAAPAAPADSTAITLTPRGVPDSGAITGENLGFSVESADLAHGFLTKPRMSQWLKTLGRHGVLRLGGYSMDLVWPAFGAYRDAPTPPEAIGGRVDRSDLIRLKALLRDSGWKATLGVPLKKIIDPSKIKSPTKDPSPPVTLDQAVAEVKAAHEILGDDLLAVEIGNEYDNVTTLTPAEYYATMKQYHAAIKQAVPHANIKVTGPSANTAKTNTQLDGFVAAVQADTGSDPRQMIAEFTNHLYPQSHCGSSNATIAGLLSPDTYVTDRNKLTGIMDITGRLNSGIPAVINESNSASCSGQPGVSDAYATSLWSLDYLLQTAQSRVSQVQFHTNTAAICGDFKARDSKDYPISYRYYGAFCAADQHALDSNRLSAAPLYYGLWAFHQVPEGRFLDVGLPDTALSRLRAYAVEGRNGALTMVLINVQDPAASTGDDDVTVNLPSAYRSGDAVTLRTSATDGLASVDASAISLGDRTLSDRGVPSGRPGTTPVRVSGGRSTVTVAPGTAQIITFSAR
ncbi:glycosyl hydrolase family 79 C-terminal domain-containing protein [Actinoallomurus iriomotensis]|uniref:glycosyl hydrolase family 79 C-terminal domain-containing protein n=1 Tax=Actinoallomurus iriomotensis TaxID=478107 RepID=UPI0025543ABD|nr:glycosyl hydrolase family 79 C-terminal domain-containing protein [Actinoallomurus iriomotensis]